MTDPNKTAITVILDRSGSMGGRSHDVRVGFRTLVETHRASQQGTCTLSLTTFSDHSSTEYLDRPIADIPALEYAPEGRTALLDAVGGTIKALGGRLAGLPERERPGKVLVLIITDGAENASHDYQFDQVRHMIEHQTQRYGWIFNFMGCGEEAIRGGQHLGISAQHTAQFGDLRSAEAFRDYALRSDTVRGCQSLREAQQATSYTAADRANLMDGPGTH